MAAYYDELDFIPAQENESVHALVRAIRAEVFSPEILWYQESLVNDLKDSVKKTQSLINDLKDDAIENNMDDDNHMISHMSRTLYEMDIERIRYLIARYLRTRIMKIEASLHFIDSHIDTKDRLSSEEKEFVFNIKKLYDVHMEENVFSRIKNDTAEDVFDKPKSDSNDKSKYKDNFKNDQPNLNEFVVCRVSDIEDLDINLQFEDKEITLSKNGIHVVEYSNIQKYILQQPADPNQSKALKRIVTNYYAENNGQKPSIEYIKAEGRRMIEKGQLEREELEKFIQSTWHKLELI